MRYAAICPAIAIAAVLALAPSAHSARRNCSAPLEVKQARYAVAVVRGPVTCRSARAILRSYLSAPRSRCGGSACYIRVRGWDCIVNKSTTGAPGCTRGRREIAAYAADL